MFRLSRHLSAGILAIDQRRTLPDPSQVELFERINSGLAEGACPAMVIPLNGHVTYSTIGIGSYASGTVATLTCNLGYTISDTLSSTCTAGTWVPPLLGTCNSGDHALDKVIKGEDIKFGPTNWNGMSWMSSHLRIDGAEPDGILSCGNPIVANGIVTYSLGTLEEPLKEPGTVALMSCNFGFFPIGSTTSTCQNGAWMPALGICSAEGLHALIASA
ncbi:unnamed protein product [Angiostrongylus costaricensis]|uniref:Sushi domain-containing protein n=1 Tax=Angiostrongylus costaricensis TaxID=334426 RepID=A0A0R3PG62_ANGCS|nr:unnamed protein product [Angiostrongylus costaricensis]